MSEKELRERVEELEQRVADLESRLDGESDSAAEPTEGADVTAGEWMPGGGQVARKTNDTIEAILAQDVSKINTQSLNDAIEAVADVHSDETLKKYRKTVTKHGPFSLKTPGVWVVER